ncbi:MAG: bifunctional [glutamine synthetase] adenylyltransferase/[glutamine synthetase]-adenylyl-L-tyrosine phosphorylase [Alphaproteobacteria bacterium]|nr:bifunctional [glutamine synthetase] adenylyltransferase/[glutamine synthetase]-adenylyl-L-tyrosine phosphorylase [Alphaproteobacteria bacterium]
MTAAGVTGVIGPALAPNDALILSGPHAGAVAAASRAPYLRRVLEARPDLAAALATLGPDAVAAAAVAAARSRPAGEDLEASMARLRSAKAELHLACACGDLSAAWTLEQVTAALSDFADAALAAALDAAAVFLRGRGELAATDPDDPRGPAPGLILLAMGKHGARELNYSSDVDVTVFYDPETLPTPPGRDAQRTAVRLAQVLVRAMEEITVDGYVFRTDLRLRPDPGATPIAVSLPAAEIYYQSVGQNWERAAFIKARACAGDIEAGRAFLAGLKSFLWRRHLDYAAIADIQSIKRQIRAVKGGAELDDPVFDVKLGRGGIRDIELFAQTQQLILGGRDPSLRAPTTKAALDALVAAGRLDAQERDTLHAAYTFYRGVEHRIQMIDDAQTHRVPARAEDRARVAALCGYADLAAFDAALLATRRTVAAIDARLFADAPSLADPIGSLVFTGVEDDPETLRTLSGLGFVRPERVSGAIRAWHHGRIRAMRSARARELLTVLTPRLLRAIAAAGDADVAFERFADFFAALPAGVQTLSLFQAQPDLLDEATALMALAPRIGALLGRQPALLDSMAEAEFARPLAQDPPGARRAAIDRALVGVDGFEAALNAVRRAQREEAFRIDVQVLTGRADADAAGAAHAELAEACVAALAGVAEAETTRRFGPPPGAYAVVALGKFGGRELAEGSDLDLMLVYDAPDAAGAAEFFTRLTQRLITALSAPTEEGGLYEVDMQLRPSGRKGPVAVALSSFARYYREEAWTWEILALTRLRACAGDPALGVRVEAFAREAVLAPRDRAATFADVAAMRARMDRDRPGKSPWSLKLAPGGFVDVEFLAQALQITAGEGAAAALDPNTGRALARLRDAGKLAPADAALLIDAWTAYARLQHWIRIVVGDGVFDPATAAPALAQRLAAVGGAADLPALEQALTRRQQAVRTLFERVIGVGDGNAPLAR